MRAVLLCLIAGALAGPALCQTSAVRSSSTAIPRAKTPSHAGTAPSRFKPDIPVSSPIFTLDGACCGHKLKATLALQHEFDSLHAAFKGIDAEFNLRYLDAHTQPELFPLSVMTQSQFHHGLPSVVRAQP